MNPGYSVEAVRYGERLRTARKAAKLSQEQLAAKTGHACSQANISKLESGVATGSEFTAQLARALRVDAYWLATGEGDPALPGTLPVVLRPLEADLLYLFRGLTTGQQREYLDRLAETKGENEAILKELTARDT
jgi:transcriptional regulator with XRE-family HTH domain